MIGVNLAGIVISLLVLFGLLIFHAVMIDRLRETVRVQGEKIANMKVHIANLEEIDVAVNSKIKYLLDRDEQSEQRTRSIIRDAFNVDGEDE